MHKSLLAGALCAVTFGFVCPHVQAQTTPRAGGRGLDRSAPQSGFAGLIEARELLLPGPNGEPSSPDKLTPDENLRRQRLAVARNAGALVKLRESLKLGIEAPFPEGNAGFSDNLSVFAGARELARLLYQEAAVRAADGDALGAAQSDLDALKLGAQISHGPLMNNLVGIAIGAIARKSLAQHAAMLDAAQSREVARQIETIGAGMQTPAQMLRAEEKFSVQSVEQLFAEMDDPRKRAQMELGLEDDDEFNRVGRELFKLSLAEVKTDYATQFDRAAAQAAQPYFAATQAAPIGSEIAYVNLNLGITAKPSTRFLFERDIVSNRLFADALRLQAVKLETGGYPDLFAASVDPFSPNLAPLIYRREGEGYLLYSVGPDGQDDNGGEIQTLTTDLETGAPLVSDRLMADSTGDILAPTF